MEAAGPDDSSTRAAPREGLHGATYPRISIVTPSYAQADFLEETIRSVLDQRYPDLEYIVIDGGSRDGSVEILERYDDELEYWVSEPDEGQADALMKGFARATGDLLGYINSDDVYLPGALHRAASDYVKAGAPDEYWAAYPVVDFDAVGPRVTHLAVQPIELVHWVSGKASLHQPGVWWTRSLYEEVGGFDPDYHCVFDRKLFMAFLAHGCLPRLMPGPSVARFRLHSESKTGTESVKGEDNLFREEADEIAQEFIGCLPISEARDLRKRKLQLSMSQLAREVGNAWWGQRWLCFLHAAIRRPDMVRTRFFWGALLKRSRE